MAGPDHGVPGPVHAGRLLVRRSSPKQEDLETEQLDKHEKALLSQVVKPQDVAVAFDSIEDALESIPTATSSDSYAVVATKLKVLPPIPPPGRGPHEWGKRSGMYTAEIVHILNENLITLAEKLDKYHQHVIGEKRKRDDEDSEED